MDHSYATPTKSRENLQWYSTPTQTNKTPLENPHRNTIVAGNAKNERKKGDGESFSLSLHQRNGNPSLRKKGKRRLKRRGRFTFGVKLHLFYPIDIDYGKLKLIGITGHGQGQRAGGKAGRPRDRSCLARQSRLQDTANVEPE
ncbi:hypothetical protein J6590_089584 [Homalodisca vitripennis]|nr:hypothetical protein J6590_089584 [Homalodisca vitripennis]